MKTQKIKLSGRIIDGETYVSEHTPTPWTMYKWDVETDTEWGIQPQESHGIIGPVIPSGKYGLDKTNAEFIVRAVNSHEELVGLLKNWLSDEYMGDSQFRELAKATIAKAEGKVL